MQKPIFIIVAVVVLSMFIFFGVVFVGIVWLGFSTYNEIQANFSKQTAETVGTMTDYYETTNRSNTASSTTRHVSFKFTVNGVTYQTTGYGGASREDIGRQGKVCYEAANPRNASFSVKPDHQCRR